MKGKNLEGLREALPHRSMSTQWSRLRTTKDLDILRDIFKNALGVLSEDLDGGGIPLLFVSSGEHWFLACLTQRNPRWLLCVRGSAGQGQEGGAWRRGRGRRGARQAQLQQLHASSLWPYSRKRSKGQNLKGIGGIFPQSHFQGWSRVEAFCAVSSMPRLAGHPCPPAPDSAATASRSWP